MPEKAKSDLCAESTIGKQLFENFFTNRIRLVKVNVWDTIKKRKLQTWETTGKQMKVNTGDKVVDLKDDRKLFTRMKKQSADMSYQ